MLGQQRLQVGLDAVLLEARVDPELVGRVVEHLGERDAQGVAVLGADLPHLR